MVLNGPMVAASPEPQANGLLKTVVAVTPLFGSLVVPLVVPLLMVRVSVGAGVLAAVLLSCLWFAAMLRTSELPGHG
jgi:MFS superfamily sulfate permease-like transporter